MIKLEVGKPVYNGYNISYHSGKTCFIRGAIEGETVLCEITLEKKNYRFCKTIKVILESKKRVAPQCSVYQKCGGCHFQHISYSEQINIKKRIAEEIFNPKTVNNIYFAKYPFRYRNKALIPHNNKKIGFYKERSNKIIEFSDCFLQSEKVNNLVNIVKKEIKTEKNLKSILIKNNYKKELLLCFITKKNNKFYKVRRF